MEKRCLGCMELYDDGLELCPHCGYVEGTRAEEAIHMSPGTILRHRYVVGKVLGYGGFGATYIGYDEVLQQRVAIKEYMPSEFATRVPGESQVMVFEGDKKEQFNDGMKKFVDEARRLAKFQNEPGIITIYDAFEENDTAYNIMEYLEGETLASYMERTGIIPEETAISIMMPIMQSLKAVHAEGILHRDISPENIFLTMDGRVKLIDFGASRYATTSHSRSLTVIIKPGYSPEEQYRSRGDQGPYTDVYAVAAVLYKMITGKTPPDALERRAMYENKNKDILVEPHTLNKEISQVRENALLNALNVKIEDRTPDIETFLAELNADEPAKRIYGSIRQMIFFKIPLWLKIALPVVVAAGFAFILLMAFGVIDFSRFSQALVVPDGVVVVPEVEGMNNSDAINNIEGSNLLALTAGNVESAYIPAGTIVLQTPVGGSYLDQKGTVELTVSSGDSVQEAVDGIATVPYLLWSSLEDAVEKLRTAGLGEPEVEEIYDDNVAVGQVISQSIDFGEQVEVGTVLTLQVSLGPKAFDMPDLAGMTEEKAKETLSDLGLSVTVSYMQDDSVKDGTVLKQDIASGTPVHRGDTVTITAAAKEDTIEVADVSGMNSEEAEKTLKDQGFNVTILENYSDTINEGDVISQTPQAGTRLKKGGSVKVYVSKGSETSSETETPAPQQYTVSFDGNGGNSPAAITVTEGQTYAGLPTSSRAGYIFAGWFTSPTGGSQIADGMAVNLSGNIILYAHWNSASVTVTFDAQGGTVEEGSRTLNNGSQYGTLPTPKKPYYTFTGWFTGPGGTGSAVSENTTVSSDTGITLYAGWVKKAYTVTWDDDETCTIVVTRIQGDTTGTLQKGDNIYYGDVLSITYKVAPYYTLVDMAPSQITVKGNLTADDIYFMTLPDEFTVIVISETETGTELDSYSDTRLFGETDFVYPSDYYGFETPGPQFISWNGSYNTFAFIYTPEAYEISWDDCSHCTITVNRSSSPFKGARTGILSKGDTVYYGDYLEITYTPDSGYGLDDYGETSITVDTSDITFLDIYAAVSSL